ncbi:MAG TPA: hemolysin family protein [Candidatus Binatus sp.]|uniref:hemolysin family protein n=1 Tax=Candidatus Binatus sp. TaxID=2811406 RepID=UPI002B46A8E8|nr:hemolysin family protein [Candidatus Binatus sp.]HKN13500.1 hemolysin family protein [Candidatus Binatus sp.]
MTAIWLVVALAGCLVMQAFFAASEIALVSADDLKVRAGSEGGHERSRVLGELLGNRDRLLALTLTGTNLATVVAAVVLTSFLHHNRPHLVYLAPFILTPITLVLGESIPKLLTLTNPHSFALFAARPLRFLATVLAPLLGAETVLSRLLRRFAGVPVDAESVFLSREDLARLMRRRPTDAPEQPHDAILPAEQLMISRIFRFSQAEARKAMVPLVGVDAVPEETSLAAAIETVRREGFSRIPVFRRRITDIVGVVHVFDLLQAPDLSRPVSDIMRPVSYFPESMPLDEALVAMQRTGENLAVIVDEYGGSAGILTLEDLVEEIVGEIEDEHDLGEELAKVVSPRVLTIVGRAPITELNERFGLKLPEADEYATIGGLVVERLGHIPRPGEKLIEGELTITVTRSDARAVRELMLTLVRPIRPELLKRR